MLKKAILIVASCMLAAWAYYYNRWRAMWAEEPMQPSYDVRHKADDTLRIGFIGDSWAGMRMPQIDSAFRLRAEDMTRRPVKVRTSGKGGERSRGIYRKMFQSEDYGTRPVLAEGLDYCIVYAGINDAAANLGTRQYCHNMSLILHHLVSCGIKPVVIEIPDVDIWNIYGDKPLKDLASDFVRSLMTGCRMYSYGEYREALKAMIKEEVLAGDLLFIDQKGWNGAQTDIDSKLFLEDRIHLNGRGYEQLDSCVAAAIASDVLPHSMPYGD